MSAITQIRRDLLADSYRPQAPSPATAKIDREACTESTCESCGHRGMAYYPFVKGSSYRPFAVCPRCGESFEF